MASQDDIFEDWWRQASGLLGVRAEIPYRLADGEGTIHCHAFLPDFGGRAGAVVKCLPDGSDVDIFHSFALAAKQLGLYPSLMFLRSTFELGAFQDALTDWGYFGDPSKKPCWLI